MNLSVRELNKHLYGYIQLHTLHSYIQLNILHIYIRPHALHLCILVGEPVSAGAEQAPARLPQGGGRQAQTKTENSQGTKSFKFPTVFNIHVH